MQNTVYECKQNGEDFFLSLSVTYSRFGNCPANGLVTEQPQYSVVVCIFSTWQNTEISLISNGLRLIFTCRLLCRVYSIQPAILLRVLLLWQIIYH